MTRANVVVGVGNRSREDDAAGPLVADEIRRRRRPDVRVVVREGDLSLLALDWSPGDHVVVIDAISVSEAPERRSLVVVDVDDLPTRRAVSSHGVGVADAVRLANEIGRTPRVLRVLGVTGGRFEIGPPPPDLVESVPELADAVLALIGDGSGRAPRRGSLGPRAPDACGS